jgi:hypothetical protein
MMRVTMRRCALLLAALLLVACSDEERDAREQQATTTQTKTTVPVEVVEIPVEATSKRRAGTFASKKELDWAAEWLRWQERMDVKLEFVDELLTDDERRAKAQTSTWLHRRLAAAVRLLRSCADDAIDRGAPPSPRLEPVALETVEVCTRVARALASAEAAGFQKELSSDAAFAFDHLETATREVRDFVPGLDEEIDDLPLVDRPGAKNKIQIRYTFAASRSVGEQVTVSCFSPRGWRRQFPAGQSPGEIGGFVEAHGAVGHLAPPVCRWLDKLAYRGEQPQDLPPMAYMAQAVLILAHEAQHATGIRNEAKAECYAMQHMSRLARLLGADASYASQITDFFWTRMYPLDAPAYRSDECRPGGKLDLRKRVTAWP